MATLREALEGLAARHGQKLPDGLLEDLETMMKQAYSAAMESFESAIVTQKVLVELSKDSRVRLASFGQVADHILGKAEEYEDESVH